MFGVIRKIFGTKNDRLVKEYFKRITAINRLEDKYIILNDIELKEEFNNLRVSVQKKEKTLNDVLNESFAITREAAKRVLELRHYDVQLIGGIVLHEGKIAEMKTGEGKTLVATLAIILNAMSAKGVHLVTVNDYLAKRDAQEMAPLYEFLGFSVGTITADIQEPVKRKEQYSKDITYGTNNEFGFDFLRDNMSYAKEDVTQEFHYFSIVDEVDSILIDEARTPLIISGPTNRTLEHYSTANVVAQKLLQAKEENEIGEVDTKSGDFVVDEKNKTVTVTESGILKAEKLFDVNNLYDIENSMLAHHLNQALKAMYVFSVDIDYVVQENEIIIVDEFTGRLSEGRRFGEGLHQAIEAKENVKIQEESQTLADITFQNYFRMYDKLAGMTGTAQTEAAEFDEIYKLDVISIPTNRPIVRLDANDLIYKSEKEKFDAVVKKVLELQAKGQPVLVGTASIEKSEYLHSIFKSKKIVHAMLNAKNHKKEAEIIEKAGIKGTITIATNMAGRGVDIKVTDEVTSLGGLFILGTERHESRRIDNQLRGRTGRQGDAGASQFFLSLEDSLLRIFGSDKIKVIMERLGIEEGEHIESKMVTRAVANAQKKVESMHFESRKHILEYDDVANKQRQIIYSFRKNLLDNNFDILNRIKENRIDVITSILSNHDIFEEGIKEEFDIDKLISTIKEDFLIEFTKNDLDNKDYDELFELIINGLEKVYENKFDKLEESQRNEIERILYLQVLDNTWREHLYQMDILKTGIGLRGYNQKDPLVEYKKESFNLFQELRERLKFETVKILQLVEFEDNKEDTSINNLKNHMEESKDNSSLSSSFEPEKKIARNELCPCNSGKKYKQCCGKSGPKKGILAK